MRKAFTIIEILIVVVMISILSGMSYFALNSIRDSLDVNYAAKQVLSDVRYAQELAKTVHFPHQVEFVRNGSLYQIVNLDDDSIVKAEKVPDGVRFDGKDVFIFSVSGNPAVGGSGTLIIMNVKGKSKKVVVSSIGRIRIE